VPGGPNYSVASRRGQSIILAEVGGWTARRAARPGYHPMMSVSLRQRIKRRTGLPPHVPARSRSFSAVWAAPTNCPTRSSVCHWSAESLPLAQPATDRRPNPGSALSINIFMPLFSICYISMGANGWAAVATRSQQDFQDQTPMIVRSLVENRVEVPEGRVTGSGDQNPNRERRNQTIR
jgi:hypothetical protein